MESFTGPEQTHIATFETDELTALCPFDFGGPDYYTLIIRYVPRTDCLESRSLKEAVESYRNKERTAEELAAELHAEILKTISPERLYVRLEQSRRGGIKETVEVGDYDLRR